MRLRFAVLLLLAIPFPPARGAAAPATRSPRSPTARSSTVEEMVRLPGFGTVPVYRPQAVERARGVVLMISGDGGWKLGVVEMARRLAPQALVAGLSMPDWQHRVEAEKGSCWYPAGELEAAAQALEKSYHFPRYQPAVLVGYSSGATVVYGALAQGPGGAFAGAVSLGFCPDLEVRRAFCGRQDWKPTVDLKKPEILLPPRPDLPPISGGAPSWLVLQGQVDQVCDPGQVDRFVRQVPAGRVVDLPKVGHGFGVPKNWGDAFDGAVSSLLPSAGPWTLPPPPEPSHGPNRAPAEIRRRLEGLDLPLVATWPDTPKSILIFVSGDGGWMDLDRELARRLHDQGVAVIGWNALRYFWDARRPEAFRGDLGRVLALLPPDLPAFAGGFSFGAEVVATTLAPAPFRAASPLSRLHGLVLLAPGPYATFEISPLDWIRTSSAPTGHPVAAALSKSGGLPILCLEPSSERDPGCNGKPVPGLVRKLVPGSHHFGGNYAGLAREILQFL